MFKKIYEKDKKILFHILSKYKFYFKNQINMEINYLNELIDFSVMANGKISAGTFYYNFLPGGENDFIRYRTGEESAVCG